jgi:hypothetical protein
MASGASRGFFYALHNGLVFENSTACVYVETSTRLRLAVADERNQLTRQGQQTIAVPDFEHKLK